MQFSNVKNTRKLCPLISSLLFVATGVKTLLLPLAFWDDLSLGFVSQLLILDTTLELLRSWLCIGLFVLASSCGLGSCGDFIKFVGPDSELVDVCKNLCVVIRFDVGDIWSLAEGLVTSIDNLDWSLTSFFGCFETGSIRDV